MSSGTRRPYSHLTLAVIILTVLFVYRIRSGNETNMFKIKRGIRSLTMTNNAEIDENQFASGDLFRSIADYVALNSSDSAFLEKNLSISKNSIIFMKSDSLKSLYKFQLRNTNRYYLISGDSDFAVPFDHRNGDFQRLLEDPNLIQWFTMNMNMQHERLSPIPIGLQNSYVPGNDRKIVAKFSTLSKPWSERSILLMVAFTVSTNANVRAPLRAVYCNTSYADCGKHTRDEYMERLTDTYFVLSPPGNGMDCHRTWESISLGAVPIVESSEMNTLFDGERVLVVDDLKKLNESYLLSEKERFAKIPFNMSKSKVSSAFWINHFNHMYR